MPPRKRTDPLPLPLPRSGELSCLHPATCTSTWPLVPESLANLTYYIDLGCPHTRPPKPKPSEGWLLPVHGPSSLFTSTQNTDSVNVSQGLAGLRRSAQGWWYATEQEECCPGPAEPCTYRRKHGTSTAGTEQTRGFGSVDHVGRVLQPYWYGARLAPEAWTRAEGRPALDSPFKKTRVNSSHLPREGSVNSLDRK